MPVAKDSHAIERKPECVCQVVDFSSVFCWSDDAIAVSRAGDRGAARPARISLARAHPASIDIEVQPSKCVQILWEGVVSQRMV